mmetsp:Transcript_6170/g.22674  ORF Transcript_6170/g.22674 Transcript_6170/m.22674 type:complete len:284 (+) Transcript_6170:5852-6703(+)
MEENAPGNVRPVVATLVGGQHAHALEQQVAQQRDLHLAAVGVVLQLPNAHLTVDGDGGERVGTLMRRVSEAAEGELAHVPLVLLEQRAAAARHADDAHEAREQRVADEALAARDPAAVLLEVLRRERGDGLHRELRVGRPAHWVVHAPVEVRLLLRHAHTDRRDALLLLRQLAAVGTAVHVGRAQLRRVGGEGHLLAGVRLHRGAVAGRGIRRRRRRARSRVGFAARIAAQQLCHQKSGGTGGLSRGNGRRIGGHARLHLWCEADADAVAAAAAAAADADTGR